MGTRLLLTSSVVALLSGTLQAQYLGDHLLGAAGLSAGSQPGPGIYVILPLFYRDDYSGVRGPQGQNLLANNNIDVNLFGVPAVQVTTPLKILGAHYGFFVLPAILDQRLTIALPNRQGGGSTGYGFTDLLVEPISLGWNTRKADIIAGYGFFAPVGGDHGLHMWEHELSLGSTVYFDSGKKWHASTLASFDINQKKNNQDVTVGDILTLEGGAGRSFLKGAGSAGLAYFAQWKITHDGGADIPAALPITNGRVFGLGPEINVPVFARGTMLVLAGFRYMWEFGAKTNFEGQTLAATITFAKIIPPKH